MKENIRTETIIRGLLLNGSGREEKLSGPFFGKSADEKGAERLLNQVVFPI